jgi:transposase
MPRLKGSADLLEDRRRRALALWDTGLSLNEVGRRIQCAASSVLRWLRTRRRGGPDALRVRSSPGRPPKLGPTQRRRLVKLLVQGPLAHGYRTNVWTPARIAVLLEHELGVHYHRDHYRAVDAQDNGGRHHANANHRCLRPSNATCGDATSEVQ